ncbi:MAG: M36 family metallopeptidase [Spirosomataceae bacterium]
MKQFSYGFVLFCALLSFRIQAQNEVQIAKNYLSQNTAKHKITQADLEGMLVSSSYLSPTTGWYHVYFNQTYQNVEVYNSMMNLVVKDGQVRYATGSFVPDIAGLVNAGLTALSPVQALQKAAQEVNTPLSSPAAIKEISSAPLADGSPGKVIFTAESLSDENIVVKKYWLVYEGKEGMKTRTKAALTWNVQFLTKDAQNSWSMHVDAQTGEILRKVDEVIHCSFGMLHRSGTPHDCSAEHAPTGINAVLAPATAMAPDKTYNVFDYPLEAPTFGARTVVPDPYTKFVPTGTGPAGANNTNGWHFDGTTDYTITRGNNVWAQEDKNGNNGTGASPSSGTLDFDFPYTQGTGNAVRDGNTNAATTNLFYWSNLIHDVLWKYGFDEPSGNFQNDNQGRGGAGGDYLFADAQDGSGINNANFSTPVDGSRPRMQMFMWTLTGGGYNGDGDFDNGVVAHEYGHGWSNRLTGGPANSSCLQNAEQGGEGWSDFLSLMLTTNWSTLTPTVASANIPRGIGTYVLGQPTTGPGIRPYRYSYDMANINPLVTYGKVSVYDGSVFAQPHGIGSIWATMLWDMTWEIILQDNQIVNNIYDTPALVTDMRGNLAALKLVNEGLRMQPCSPSFVQARDAIFAADQLLFGGRYHCAIGKAFARRGLGLNASTGTSTNDRIVTEDFTPFPSFILGSSTLAPSICTNTPFAYTATSTTGTPTFSWTRAVIPGISNAAASGNSATINETLINTTTNPVTVDYYFTLSPDVCNAMAPAQKVSVVVNPSAVPTVATYALCQNTTVPSGEGLVVMPVLTNVITGSLTAGSPTYNRGVGNNINTYIAAVSGVNTDPNAGNNIRYQTFTFVAPTSGTVSFETIAGTLTSNGGVAQDTYLTLYQTSFNPASPATNFIKGDDDSGTLLFASKVFADLTAGTTYVLVVTPYFNAAIGGFTIRSSIPVFSGGTNNWYKDPSGGAPLATGEVFNPVGVAGSGIANTATPVTMTYYVANAVFPDCRTPVTFTIKPTPASALAASKVDVCPNTEVTLSANCTVPTATVQWNPGAPTVTPNAPNVSYLYKATCTLDGCTGNESSIEVRTHRILVDLKNIGMGVQPKAIAGAVADNLAPTNAISTPTSPRLWTILASGCSASESAVFKLTGPVNFSSIDNNPPYAIFANVGSDYFAIDHPNYGNGTSGFPNGTYTLTVDLRGADGVGGPFPKNRVATGALLATRTLQFTLGTSTRQGVEEALAVSPTELTEEAWLSVGQNPVNTEVVVRLSGKVGQTVELSLTNLQGQTVQQRSVVLSSVQQYEVLNVTQAASGMYVLKGVKDNQAKTFKVVKMP